MPSDCLDQSKTEVERITVTTEDGLHRVAVCQYYSGTEVFVEGLSDGRPIRSAKRLFAADPSEDITIIQSKRPGNPVLILRWNSRLHLGWYDSEDAHEFLEKEVYCNKVGCQIKPAKCLLRFPKKKGEKDFLRGALNGDQTAKMKLEEYLKSPLSGVEESETQSEEFTMWDIAKREKCFNLGFEESSEAHISSGQSVKDFFLEIPAEKIPFSLSITGQFLSLEERRALIKEEDSKNGYLRLEGEFSAKSKGGKTVRIKIGGQVALFKRSDKSLLLVLSLPEKNYPHHVVVFRKTGESWRDVTRIVLPKPNIDLIREQAKRRIPGFKQANEVLKNSLTDYTYDLPRHGTTVDVTVMSPDYNGPRIVLWRLIFDGEAFKISKD